MLHLMIFYKYLEVDFDSKGIRKSDSRRELDEKDFVKLERRWTREATSKARALTTDAIT
jgi:hypothetical protein